MVRGSPRGADEFGVTTNEYATANRPDGGSGSQIGVTDVGPISRAPRSPVPRRSGETT